MSKAADQPFGRLRALFWPIHRFEVKRFVPLLIIYALVVFNYSILRAAKDALVITAPSSGAECLPFIKVWAILPMALLLTFFFTRLSNRFNQEKVFYIMIGTFLSFFLIFSFILFPLREVLHPHATADLLQASLPEGFKGLISIFRNWTFTLFYVMSELWGTTIMTMLFWGIANAITPVNDAKRFYVLFGVGANLATIMSGQVSCTLTSGVFKLPLWMGADPWAQTLGFVTLLVVLIGIAAMGVFRWYTKHVIIKEGHYHKMATPSGKSSKEKLGLRKSFSYLARSKYLLCIAVIVLTYNISLNMIEIIWKDQLRLLYPHPNDYAAYMGKVLMAMGFLSTIIGLFFCGKSIRKFGWTASALATPVILLSTGIFFFVFLLFKDSNLILMATALLGTTPLVIGVLIGTIQNCLSRACKYTIFDATKEISFIPLNPESKLKGKAAIDGVGSRLGKSGGSIFHQVLLMIFGSVALSTPYVGVILLFVVGGWIIAVKALGRRFTRLVAENQKIDIDAEKPGIEPLLEEPSTQEALV